MFAFYILFFSVLSSVYSRDFYVGMFKKNDILMAQDFLYKEKVPFGISYAKYGRLFSCPISFIRVSDRLGIGYGPRVEMIRGGLRNKAVVLRLTSVYNYPISVNIYIGCENKMETTTKIKKVETTNSTTPKDSESKKLKDTENPNDKEKSKDKETPGDKDKPKDKDPAAPGSPDKDKEPPKDPNAPKDETKTKDEEKPKAP